MTTEKRRPRGFFSALVSDPYRKLAAIGLGTLLWFVVNAQIVGSTSRVVPLVTVGSVRTGDVALGSRLAVVLPTDRVVGQRFMDGDRPIEQITVVLSGPRYRVEALRDTNLDLQVVTFAGLDLATRKDVEFTAADIRRDLQGITIELQPARVRLELERIDSWEVKLSLDNVELQGADFGNRLRRDTAEFTPETATILGTAAALQQIRQPGPKPLRARLPANPGTSRLVTAGIELAAPKELGLKLAENSSVTMQMLPETSVFDLELPLIVDDMALPPEQRGLYVPEKKSQFVRICAGGDLRSKLVSLGEGADKTQQKVWAAAYLRLLVHVPAPESGPAAVSEIVREARLLLLGPLQATVDRSECFLEEPVSVTLRKRT